MEGVEFSILNGCIDLVFGIDIFVNFRTTFIDSKGDEIFKPREIGVNYLKFFFWIDLVATLPLDFILAKINDSHDPKYELFGLLKMGRLLKLSKII